MHNLGENNKQSQVVCEALAHLLTLKTVRENRSSQAMTNTVMASDGRIDAQTYLLIPERCSQERTTKRLGYGQSEKCDSYNNLQNLSYCFPGIVRSTDLPKVWIYQTDRRKKKKKKKKTNISTLRFIYQRSTE